MKEKIGSASEYSKTLKTFAAASFLNDMGSDMIYPIWPLFIRNVLGASMTALGIIDGIGDVIVSLSQAGSGYLSDRLNKRKVFVWTGYLMGGLSRIGYSIAGSLAVVLPFRILDRAGKIRGAPRDAIVADISTNKTRGKNFGVIRTADNLGAVCGILICLALIDVLNYSTIFLIAAIPSLVAVYFIIFRIRETSAGSGKLFRGLSLKDLNPDFRIFLILSAIFSLGSFSYSFLLLLSQDAHIRIKILPVLYLIFTVIAALSSYPFGYLADRFGRKIVIAFGFLFWAIICFGFIVTQNIFVIIFLFVLYGLQRGALETAQKAFVAEICPPEFRSSSLGGFQMVTGLCALPASLIAGLLWDSFSKKAPLVLSVFLTLVSLLLLLFVREKRTLSA